MSTTKIYPMSLNSDTFNALKSDFDQMLRKLLTGMEKFECEEATLNIKVGVKLEQDQARDFSITEYEAMHDIVKPTFKHEITSAMQVKDKKSGSLNGEYELVWDKDSGQYVMRKIDDGQVTLFDEDAPQKQDPPALPDGSIIDAEYSEVVEGDEEPSVDENDSSDGGSEPQDSPFEYLRQFIGVPMKVTEAKAGTCTVRTNDGKVIVSSAFPETDPFYCPEAKMRGHVDHSVVCVGYGDEDIVNVSIECEDCGEVIFDIDATPDEGDNYPYEDPDEEA